MFDNPALNGVPAAALADKPGRQKGGRREAEKLLHGFVTRHHLMRYPFALSSPLSAWDGCSRLSPYLAYGVVSDRELFQAVDRVVSHGQAAGNDGQFEVLTQRARFFLDRLRWRQGYIQAFEHDPDIEHRCVIPELNDARVLHSPFFEAWCAGRTGFPFIDACMRFLLHNGWINMRARATLVSFATMNLWLPVQKVAQFLATQFLDYEPAVHHTIHQVVSGTLSRDFGLMVYDPIKQGQDHDPDGTFIRRWVPELAVPGLNVHDLSASAGQLSDVARRQHLPPYPAALVDHKATARKAKDTVHALQQGMQRPGTTQISLL